MFRTAIITALAAVGVASLSTATVSAAPPPLLSIGSSVAVSGAVTTPETYSLTDLSALPQVSVASSRAPGGSVTGVSLQSLVTKSAPRFDTGKNPLLRVAVTVRGVGRAVSFALGELDPGFGDHPAVLTPATFGSLSMRTDLVVPGDRNTARTVFGVNRIEVSLTPPGPITAPEGTIDVVDGARTVTLSTAALSRLPQRSQTVSFTSTGTPTSRTFVGPDLATALRSIGVVPNPFTSTVTVTATDGYAATVTLGEASVGNRPLLLALSENGTALTRPRLVAAGDKKGGRYITDTTSIVIRNN